MEYSGKNLTLNWHNGTNGIYWTYFAVLFLNDIILLIPVASVFHHMKVTQLCLTLCDHMDCTVHGILQARILEWVAIPFSRGSSQLRDRIQGSWIADGFFTSWATREAHIDVHI